MLKRLLLFIILPVFAANKIQAQVNLQTGSSTFSLPIFNWQDDKSRLNSVVALSYNSGNGLKVNETASNIGQGWNLIAGGQIVRMQTGEPDDQVVRNGNGTDYDVTKYPSGILYATVPAYNGCPNALLKYPVYGWKNQFYAQHNVIAEDKQLDYFAFQFNGKAGMFVLDPTNIGVAQSLGDTKMKITFTRDNTLINQGIRTDITSFTIQDVDGLKYKFALHGLTKALKTEYSDQNFNYKQKQPKFKNNKVFYQSAFDDGTIINPWVIGSWYLTEIEDPLTLRKITFTYTVPAVATNSAGEDITSNYTNKDYCIVSHKISVTKTPQISSVVYPDNHIVTINYGKDRLDFNGEKAVASIDVTYQGRYLSRHELTTSYFILNRYGTPVSDYQKKVARLCLRSVRKIGVDLKEDTPPYIFDYYTGSNAADDYVPPPFSYAKDIWGFYNGNNSKGKADEAINLTTPVNKIKDCNKLRGLCYMHDGVTGVYLNPKAGYAKNGLLRQIIYPTGGTLTYQYDQNAGVLGGTNRNVGGVHVSQTSSTDGGYSNPCATSVSTQYNYVLEGAGNPSSLWGLEMPANSMISNNHYQPEWKSWHYTLNNPLFGECYWHFQYPGIMSRQQVINLLLWQHALAILSPVLGIIGITQDIIAAFAVEPNPASLIIDIIVGLVDLALTCIGDQARNSQVTTYYNTDLNGAAPLPTQFKRVEVVENPGAIGKTIQEFTSEDDYPVWEPANFVFSAKQRFATWAYGLPKKTSVLDASGNMIKQTINTYNFSNSKNILNYCSNHGIPCNTSGLLTTLVSCKCEVDKTYSQRSTKWTDPSTHNPGFQTASGSDMKVDFYGMYTGRTELSSTTEKIYKTNDPSQYTQTTTDYFYNDGIGTNNYEPNYIKTRQSNGDENYKYIKYTGDYTGGVISTLVQNNILSLPVETSSAVYKVGSLNGQTYLGEKVTEFVQLANGDIKPSRILEQRFNQPQAQASMTFYQGPGSNTSNYKVPQIFTYDATGNLIGLKDEGSRQVSNIYDYNDKYVVASLINADPLIDTKAYTSFETATFGGWTLTGTSTVTNTAITGGNSFVLSAGKSFSSSLNTAKPHILSFWSTTGTVSVSAGATLKKSAPAYNGFTYYEYEIAQGTANVTVSGTGNIDELRLYPKTARIRTVTYDPVIGKTSECDENNRITYYEYDNLGRLRFVKDEKKNIVKMHEYNNVSAARQNGCPGTYYNRFISEIFTRNNCGAGYEGGEITFTVAANTYSSAISQEDADAQAEHYILTNAQGVANTTGSCQLIYYNTAISITDTTQNCLPGYTGGLVTYTVPAGRYSSIISQADADEMAMDELEANAQIYANDPANAVCLFNSNPDWTWLEGAGYYCQNVSGTPHLFVFETDINPNSSTYNQTRWNDVGPDSEYCPPCANCSGPQYACVYGNCELGIRVNIASTEVSPGVWECVYHYEFSDGSWSNPYIEYNSYPCPL